MCWDFNFIIIIIIIINSFASCLRIYPGHRHGEGRDNFHNRILWRYTHMSCLHGIFLKPQEIARWKLGYRVKKKNRRGFKLL